MKTIKNLKAEEIRKSILQLAIQGKLVKQDPNDEPASELVKRIYEEKKKLIAEGKIKKDKNESYIFKGEDNCYYEKIGKSEPVKLDDLPFDIPDTWTWVRINNYVQKVTDFVASGSFASLRENVKYYKTEEYALMVKTQDFQNDFTRDLTYTDKHGYNFLENSNLFGGELVLANVGSIGKIFIVPKLNKPMTLAPNSIMVRFFDEEHLPWFLYLFQSSFGLNTLLSISTATAIKKFNKTDFKTLLIPIPPLNEQLRIINKIKSFDHLIYEYNKYETKLTELESTFADKLKKSILQYAIEGKLVKQDPNDEPASALLERIKAEKEKLIKEGKIKRDKNESYIYQGDDKNYYENIVNKWVISRLVDVGFITGGGTPKTEIDSYWNGNIVWITPADLAKKTKTISDSKKKITYLGLKNSSAKLIKESSIIMSSRAPIGYISINSTDLCTSQGCKSFTRYSHNILNIEYVYYYLNAIVEDIQKRGSGTTFKEISGKELGLTPIMIPPLNEQLRIINRIDQIKKLIE